MTERRTPPPDPTESKTERPVGQLSRRSFLGRLGATGIAVTATPVMGAAAQETAENLPPARQGTIPVRLNINGRTEAVQIEPRMSLLDCLREELKLTGTRKGCDHGQCGACTVHINGRRVNSCLTFAAMHEDDAITTIEGIGQPGSLHPMQQAFVEHDAYQCGICTSGQIMSAVALLKEPCGKDDASVREAMAGNICRCGAYTNILAAVQQVRSGPMQEADQTVSAFVEDQLNTWRTRSIG